MNGPVKVQKSFSSDCPVQHTKYPRVWLDPVQVCFYLFLTSRYTYRVDDKFRFIMAGDFYQTYVIQVQILKIRPR